MLTKFLRKSLFECKANEYIKTLSFHLVLSQKVFQKSFSSESDLKCKEQLIDTKMSNKDIYDETFIPPILRKPGEAMTRFKRYFYEKDYKRKPQIDSVLDKQLYWNTKCHLFEPKEVTFTAKAKRKKDSESIAMAKTLMWLRDLNFIDNAFNEIKLTNREFEKFMEWTNSPIDIKPINTSLRNDMKDFCDSFDQQLRENLSNICGNSQKTFDSSDCTEEMEEKISDFDYNIGNNSTDVSVIRNIFNNEKYEEPNDRVLIDREIELNLFVKQRKVREETDPSFAKLRQKVSELPINEFKKEIIETIEQNRVVVISGDTGCGKTTQVPQIIFDNEILNQRGAFTNVVVTEPRRLAAIAISERIAQEFGEEVIGNSIGYNVRFDKMPPKHTNGVIMFCSAGILLRKLSTNPTLKGVSHVIIDEVHERDVIIDFLLVLLKRILDMNPNIRIILMSASMNANLFVEYFDCPIIQIPGRCYEVKHYYLNDFCDKIGKQYLVKQFSIERPKMDSDLIVDLIKYIDKTKGDGAILCFLPGWPEIHAISKELEEQCNGSNHLMIVPVHSMLPHSSQKQIFKKTPVGVRKVVLSTNIAETSLTIDDVVYVIDSGLAKEMRYNSRLNVSNFGTNWISKANAKQRSGRAGRVQSGECYRIYSRDIESAYMDDFPIPELLRIPLENVVMQAKHHCPNELVALFLSEVPQPPTVTAIEKAVELLREIKVLDENENLTNLGKRIVGFTTHPRLSVALVYSTLFSCVKSMLPLVSQLSANREPFHVMPDQKQLIREIKDKYSYSLVSDHIPLVDLTLEYQELTENKCFNELNAFREENHLHRYSMDSALETMRLFASHLDESKLIYFENWNDPKSAVNFNWHRKHIMMSALIPGLVPNFVRLMRGEIKKQVIKNNSLYPLDTKTGRKVKFVGESVFNRNFNSIQNLEQLSNSILIYFGSFFSSDAQMLTICEASVVSPISILLFSDNIIESNNSNDECVVVLRNNKYLQFKLSKEDLQLIRRWTSVLNLLFQWFLIPKELSHLDESENDKINNYLQDFIQLTDELLQ